MVDLEYHAEQKSAGMDNGSNGRCEAVTDELIIDEGGKEVGGMHWYPDTGTLRFDYDEGRQLDFFWRYLSYRRRSSHHHIHCHLLFGFDRSRDLKKSSDKHQCLNYH